ncbi:YkgJ family cysteine cluster protein [Gemmatimonadota bacterium]
MSDEERPPLSDESRSRLEEKILSDHARMGLDDKFHFGCHPGISCFNNCCADVNIFLSPYDVLRLKSRLGMTSTDFLDKYALLPVQADMKTPVVVLRMNDDEAKTCPFLTESGCGVYTDRPWPCRMYPLGLAASKDTPDGWRGERFYFLLKEEGCQGFGEAKEWTVREWLDDQGMDAYDQWGEAFKELTLHTFFEDDGTLSPERLEMFFTASYDLDKFRDFVFESTLLERFDVDEDFVEEMRHNDEALLRFSFLWLQFSLFGEKTMRINPDAAEALMGEKTRDERKR